MDKIDEMIQEIEKFKEIPYYIKHFQRLTKILLEKYYKCPKERLSVKERAELQVVLAGICYYYRIVTGENVLGDTKRICLKLIESTNRAIYALWDEIEKTRNGSRIYCDYLPAYKEYLQSVCNAFRSEQIQHHLDAPSLIFTFALELLGSKVYMHSLFAQIYETKVTHPAAFLCAVFVPTDEEESLNDVYKYLPMLTHEVSHNFKYSETADRNSFIVDYMLEKISDHIIRRLMMQAADGKRDMFIGRAPGILAKALAGALKKELEKVEPEYIEKGHLDYLPSLIYSVLKAPVESDEYSVEYYPGEESRYDILYKCFTGLAGRSTLKWYITTREDCVDRSDSEVIASLLMDIMTGDNYEQIKWYREIILQNEAYHHKIGELLDLYEKDRLRIDKELIIVAAEEILFSVMEKIAGNFKEYRAKNSLADVVLSNLASNAEDFQKYLDKLIESTEKEDEQIIYGFIDCCVSTKNFVNSIYYLCKKQDQYIEKKAKGSDMMMNIYEKLRESVSRSLSNQKEKPYFAARDTHALIIKLGLLNGRNRSEEFIESYKSVINVWDKQKMYETIEDYLAVYREVFADLSMCAVFQFNQLGYLRYLTSQFSSTREMGEQFQTDMALERIHIVLRTIEHEHPKDEFIEIYANPSNRDLGIEWTKEWENIIRMYVNGDRRDEYDERYYKVYTTRIVPSDWVKSLRNDEIIRAIGDCYNRLEKVSEEEKNKVSRKFFKKYLALSEKREEQGKIHGHTPIEIMLEANQDENK